MGTNVVDFLVEAWRVLRIDGRLKVAEVASRFVSVQKFTKAVESLGFSLVSQDSTSNYFIFKDQEKG
eukprot:m.190884 g.190884  ORF g.190884 m.190884 type:complete len:67 (+) comp39438_c0_seq2:952-1152(+)